MKSRGSEASLLFAVFLDLLGFGMIISDIQLRAQEYIRPLGLSPGPVIGALLASTFIIQTLVSPRWGVLSDRIGRKPVVVGCTAISALAMLVYGLSNGLVLLFASRILAGFGAANVAVAQALIADKFDGPARTAALGRVGAAISVGLITGPPLGGLLAHFYGSHVLGFTAAAASFLGALWMSFTLDSPKPVHEEQPKKRKLIDVSLLTELPKLRPLVLIAIISWFSLATLEGTFARLIKALFGYDQLQFGFLFGYEAFLGFVVQGILLALAVRWFRESKLLKIAYVLQGVGLALNPFSADLVAFLPGLVTLFIASTLYALGSSLANPTVNSLCSKMTPDSRQGELFGLLQGTRSIGFVAGPVLGGWLFDHSPQAPYYMAGAVCLLAALLVPKVDEPTTDTP